MGGGFGDGVILWWGRHDGRERKEGMKMGC